LALWDRHILDCRLKLLKLQVSPVPSSSEDRLERQLDILQAQQLEIMDALTAMEYEVQRLRRFRVQIRFNLLFSSLVLNTFLSD
jgi:hypothetical protein